VLTVILGMPASFLHLYFAVILGAVSWYIYIIGHENYLVSVMIFPEFSQYIITVTTAMCPGPRNSVTENNHPAQDFKQNMEFFIYLCY